MESKWLSMPEPRPNMGTKSFNMLQHMWAQRAENVHSMAQHGNNMGQHTPNRTAGVFHRSSVANTPVRAVVVTKHA